PCHFSQPPSKIAAWSKPKARSIHHTRVAHMIPSALYRTTRVPSPTPQRDITAPNCCADGSMKRNFVVLSDSSPLQIDKPRARKMRGVILRLPAHDAVGGFGAV